MCKSIKNVLQGKPVESVMKKNTANIENMSKKCFIENGILWNQHTVIVLPNSQTQRLIKENHGNVMFGYDGQYKTKGGILQPFCWPGMDKEINDMLGCGGRGV